MPDRSASGSLSRLRRFRASVARAAAAAAGAIPSSPSSGSAAASGAVGAPAGAVGAVLAALALVLLSWWAIHALFSGGRGFEEADEGADVDSDGGTGSKPQGASDPERLEASNDEPDEFDAQVIARVEERLAGCREFEPALAAAAGAVRETLGGRASAVWMGGMLLAPGIPEGVGEGSVAGYDLGLLGDGSGPGDARRLFAPWAPALRAGEVVCVPDPASEPDLCGRVRLSVGSLVLAPFPDFVAVRGVLAIGWPSPLQVGPQEAALARRLGTTVGLALERARIHQELSFGRAQARVPVEAAAPFPATVLVVEDEPAICSLLADLLESAGYRALTARTGREAVERLIECSVHAVLTDLGMPEMSGWEVARHCRDLYPGIPVILITGWEVELDEAMVAETRVRAVVSKPFSVAEVLQAVARVVEDSPAAREAA